MKKTLKKSLLRLVTVTLVLSSCLFACNEKNEQLLPSKDTFLQNGLSKDRVNIESPKYIEDESIKGEYELRDGALHFKNVETYFKIWQKFSKMKPEERVEASKAMGLKSLLEIQHEFVLKTEKVNSKQEYEALLNGYSDIVTFKDSIQSFINSDGISAALINRNGIVYLGKSLRRYKGNKITNIENGDENLLDAPIDSDLVKTYKYIENIDIKYPNGRLTTTCPTFQAGMTNGDYIQRNSGVMLGGDRAIYMKIEIQSQDFGSGNWWVTPYSRGIPYRTHWWGGPNHWYEYSTVNNLGSNWECTVVGNGGTQTKTSVANYSYSNTWNFIDYAGDSILFMFYPTPFIYTGFNFNYNGNTYYYSQGVSASWIIASCI